MRAVQSTGRLRGVEPISLPLVFEGEVPRMSALGSVDKIVRKLLNPVPYYSWPTTTIYILDAVAVCNASGGLIGRY